MFLYLAKPHRNRIETALAQLRGEGEQAKPLETDKTVATFFAPWEL